MFQMVFVQGTLVGGANDLQALIDSDEFKKNAGLMGIANVAVKPSQFATRQCFEARAMQ